jgi:hypothetical protein
MWLFRALSLFSPVSLLLALLACRFTAQAQPPATRPLDRQAFAEAMFQLRNGMPEAEILALLGPPDDIRTENDPGGIPDRYKSIWRYGTAGHLTFATLGKINISKDGKAIDVPSTITIPRFRTQPPPADVFDEMQLRALLRVIDRTPVSEGMQFNPRRLIEVVNTLQPLGKDKALAAISEYLRVGGAARDGTLLLLRALFEMPDDPGYMPDAMVGMPLPRRPAALNSVIPRYPLAIVDDVPFVIARGVSGSSSPPPQPQQEIPYFRDNAQIRARQLVPPDQPLALYDKALQISDRLENSPTAHYMLAHQMLLLLDSVYRLPANPGEEPDNIRPAITTEYVQRVLGYVDSLRVDPATPVIRWDRQNNRYVFAKNGAFLPEPVKKTYWREVWNTELFGRVAQAIAERQSEKQVQISVQYRPPPESTRFSVRVYVWDPAHPENVTLAADKPVDSFVPRPRPPETPPRPEGVTVSGFNVTADCPEGWQAQLELQVGETKVRSNTWTP